MPAGRDAQDDRPGYDEPELPKPRLRSDAASNIAADPKVGDVVGPYALLGVLGRGGAGTVFKARRTPTGQIVALKVLAAAKVRRARIVQRFFDEVRAASLVAHPGLVKVYDFLEQDDPRRLAYAMEFLDGESLRRRLRRDRALDLRTAIAVGRQICSALTALHEAGIIHRDLKPENALLVQRGQGLTVKLLDFGVVKFLPLDKTASIEQPAKGTFVGTPRYMAPEQAAGAVVDHRADLFSVGVILFEMITGACPHQGDSLRDVVLAKLKGAPRITVNPEREVLPQELTEIVDACLRLKPEARPASAAQVEAALADADLVLSVVGKPVRLAGAPAETVAAAFGRVSPRDDLTAETADPEASASVDQDTEAADDPPGGRRWGGLLALIAVALALGIGLGLLFRADPVLVLPEPPAAEDAPAEP